LITGNHQAHSGLVLRGRTHWRRVLRGGSFNNNDQNVRCANRNRNDPDNRNRNNGFRVVASTLFKARDSCLPELRGGERACISSGPRRKMAESVPGLASFCPSPLGILTMFTRDRFCGTDVLPYFLSLFALLHKD
jgi:hypothetical protein